MKVLLLGKRHAEGVGRQSGKPYSLNFVSISYADRSTEGAACDTVALNADTYDFNSLIVGKTYNFDRDSRGYVLDFSLAN